MNVKNLKIPGTVVATCLLLTGLISAFTPTPKYVATARLLYIEQRYPKEVGVDPVAAKLQVQLLREDKLKRYISDAELSPYSDESRDVPLSRLVERLTGDIEIRTIEHGADYRSVCTVSVRNKNPKKAALLANVLIADAREVSGGGIQTAAIPSTPESIRPRSVLVIGVCLTALVGFLVVVVPILIQRARHPEFVPVR